MRYWMQNYSAPRLGDIRHLAGFVTVIIWWDTLGQTSFLSCVLWMLETLDSVRISCKMWPVLCLLPECLNNSVFSRSFQIPTGYNCGRCVMQVIPLVVFFKWRDYLYLYGKFQETKIMLPSRKMHLRMVIELKRFQFVSLRWRSACPSPLLPFSELNAWTTRSICVCVWVPLGGWCWRAPGPFPNPVC